MRKYKKRKVGFLLLLVVVGGFTFPGKRGFSQEPLSATEKEKFYLEKAPQEDSLIHKETTPISPFLTWINTPAYAEVIDKGKEKKRLRKVWEKMLGVDIFYPYFKAKEVEDWVKEKAKVQFFKIKGKPEFNNDKVQYIFKIKF
ncbi:MAG: hypothetical protein J7K17_01715 [Candidatus Omnitrophica bacterium]|nr:hypothetical protein [Candidatus Omnitrophota bacterium]